MLVAQTGLDNDTVAHMWRERYEPFIEPPVDWQAIQPVLCPPTGRNVVTQHTSLMRAADDVSDAAQEHMQELGVTLAT